MTFGAVRKNLKFPVIFIIFGIMVFGFACMGTGGYMNDMNNYNQVSLQNNQPCCNGTSFVSHINLWENTLLAIPVKASAFLWFTAFWFALAFFLYQTAFRRASKNRALLSGMLYHKQNPDVLTFNHVKLALARGLLKPKIY